MIKKEKNNFYILTGCSGGGKSTLLAALEKRDFLCVPEAGRDIVRQQDLIGGDAVPWRNGSALCELILSKNICNFEQYIEKTEKIFFDRSIPEAIGYDHVLGRLPLAHHIKAAAIYRYNPAVFMLPPWPEIFVHDAERRHSIDDAVLEYDLQKKIYLECGYRIIDVPKLPVEDRVAFVMANL